MVMPLILLVLLLDEDDDDTTRVAGYHSFLPPFLLYFHLLTAISAWSWQTLVFSHLPQSCDAINNTFWFTVLIVSSIQSPSSAASLSVVKSLWWYFSYHFKHIKSISWHIEMILGWREIPEMSLLPSSSDQNEMAHYQWQELLSVVYKAVSKVFCWRNKFTENPNLENFWIHWCILLVLTQNW